MAGSVMRWLNDFGSNECTPPIRNSESVLGPPLVGRANPVEARKRDSGSTPASVGSLRCHDSICVRTDVAVVHVWAALRQLKSAPIGTCCRTMGTAWHALQK
jgi:hypothetical protein